VLGVFEVATRDVDGDGEVFGKLEVRFGGVVTFLFFLKSGFCVFFSRKERNQ